MRWSLKTLCDTGQTLTYITALRDLKKISKNFNVTDTPEEHCEPIKTLKKESDKLRHLMLSKNDCDKGETTDCFLCAH